MIGKNGKLLNTCVVIFMMMNMLWLTVSLPIIADSRLDSRSVCQTLACDTPLDAQGEDAGFPQTGATEEKGSEGSNSFNEEYLHHYEGLASMGLTTGKTTMHDLAQDAYCAFHGELLVPPPNEI